MAAKPTIDPAFEPATERSFEPTIKPSTVIPILSRASFPDGFLFGTSSAAYQYEGASSADGKGESIWDKFTKEHSDLIYDGKNGMDAVDFYNRYKDDVMLMKEMGLDAFRFSISWSRVLPSGKRRCDRDVNEAGIKFYADLIKLLKDNEIEPIATLFHWDVPQALENEYGGFLSDKIVDDFRNYADLCFEKFGNEVQYWTTLNEPFCFSYFGYGTGTHAPGRRTPMKENIERGHRTPMKENIGRGRRTPMKENIEPFTLSYRCSFPQQPHTSIEGDSAKEPYLVAHNQILAHANVVKLYNEKYKYTRKDGKNGMIGISHMSEWMEPKTDSYQDKEAAQRALDFMFGWFMEPLTTGDYPHRMKDFVGDRLPTFEPKERDMLKKYPIDFLDLHYYTAKYVSDASDLTFETESCMTDPHVIYSVHRYNEDEDKREIIGEQAGSHWLYCYPKGIQDLLRHIKRKYSVKTIYIMENGFNEVNDNTLSADVLGDVKRIKYHEQHLSYILKAINDDKIKVMGYFPWSLLDNFEWGDGYSIRFGMIYVDYKRGLKRIPKLSFTWFKTIIEK